MDRSKESTGSRLDRGPLVYLDYTDRPVEEIHEPFTPCIACAGCFLSARTIKGATRLVKWT